MKTKYNRPMLILRSTLYWIWSFSVTALMGIPVLGGRLISYEFCLKMAYVWLSMTLWGLKFFCGLSWKIEGRENVPDHACLILSKHQSTWETYVLPTVFPRSVYVAKKSLTRIPVFGWALMALNYILIDRTGGKSALSQMVEQSRERFAENISVIVFPEGTRMPPGSETNYRIGGGVIAEETGVDVIPIAQNAGEFWPRMGYIKWPGEVTLSIGPVIKSEGKNAEQIIAEAEQWIESRMDEITVLDRFPY